jgi:type II secretory pathway component GspD/PulD (secretin)
MRIRLFRSSPILALCLLAATPIPAAAQVSFAFENADIRAVIRELSAHTGIPLLFDPAEVTGRITLLAPAGVSPAEALELLRSALALLGYELLDRAGAMWIVRAEPAAGETFVVRVVPLTYASADEVAYTLAWIAPPSVRVVPYPATNSLIIAGHPEPVAALLGVIGGTRSVPATAGGPGAGR